MADRSSLSFLQAVSSAVCLVVAILAAESQAQCNGDTSVLTATSYTRSLPLPEYSHLYNANINCTWILQTSSSWDTIKIDVIFLNMDDDDCNSTQMEIFDGDWKFSPRLARLCGNVRNKTFNTSGPEALISFITDENTEPNDFYILYKAQTSWDSLTTTASPPWWFPTTTTQSTTTRNPACVAGSGTTLYAMNFPMQLRSPNYYGSNIVYSDCRWLLRSVFGGILEIVVTYVRTNTQYSRGCADSYLDIFDGVSSSDPLLARLCDNTNEYKTYNSTGSSLFLSFSSTDGMFGTYGFSIRYSAHRPATTTTAAPWWMMTTRTWPWWMTTPSSVTARSPTPLTAFNDYVLHFSSPNYPYPYPPNANYTWLIQSQTFGYKVTIVVENFSLENSTDCINDRLEIFDGGSEYYPRLALLCGKQSNLSFNSTGSTALVSFTTDSYAQDSGFVITYSAIWFSVTATTTPLPWWPPMATDGSTSSICVRGVTLSAEYLNGKYIEWPNNTYYYYNYPNNAACAWRLLAELDYVIHVRVIKMDLEFEEDCAYDAVTLYDSSRESNSSMISKLCGNVRGVGFIDDYYSSGNIMYITFTSDSSITGTGFRLMYEAVLASDVKYAFSTSYNSVRVGVIVGVVVAVIVIAVLGALIIISRRHQALRRHTARRLRATQTERLQASPPYTTLSSQFVCRGVVLGPRSVKPVVEGRPDVGYSNPGYAANTIGYGPPPTYTDLLIQDLTLPATGLIVGNNNSGDRGDISAVPSVPPYTSSAAPKGASGGRDKPTVPASGSLDPKRLSYPWPPTYDDVMTLLITAPASGSQPPEIK